MDFDGPFDGPGFGPWGGWLHAVTLILGGFVWLLGVALLLAVVFFLIRFLLVATRAAQIYVNRHSPAEPERAADTAPASAATSPAASTPTTTPPTASTPTATTPTATTTKLPRASTTAATKPVSKPRTPRTPPPSDTPAP